VNSWRLDLFNRGAMRERKKFSSFMDFKSHSRQIQFK